MGWSKRVLICLPIIVLVGGVSAYGCKLTAKQPLNPQGSIANVDRSAKRSVEASKKPESPEQAARETAKIKRLTTQLEAEGFKLKPQQFYAVAPLTNKAGMAPVHKALALLAKESLSLKRPNHPPGSPESLDPSDPADEAVITQNFAVLKPGILAFCKAAIDPKALIPCSWDIDTSFSFIFLARYKAATILIGQLGVYEAATHHPQEALQDFKYGEQLAEVVGRQPTFISQLDAVAQRHLIDHDMIQSLHYLGNNVPYLKDALKLLGTFQTEDFEQAMQGETAIQLSIAKGFADGSIDDVGGKHHGPTELEVEESRRIPLETLTNAATVFPVYKKFPTNLYQQSLHLKDMSFPGKYGLSFPNRQAILVQEAEISRKRLAEEAFLFSEFHATHGKWPTSVLPLPQQKYILDPSYAIKVEFKNGDPILSFTASDPAAHNKVITRSAPLGTNAPPVTYEWMSFSKEKPPFASPSASP